MVSSEIGPMYSNSRNLAGEWKCSRTQPANPANILLGCDLVDVGFFGDKLIIIYGAFSTVKVVQYRIVVYPNAPSNKFC